MCIRDRPFTPEYGERAQTAQALQDADLDADEVGMENTEHLIGGVGRVGPVSYTHLDVYKRQEYGFEAIAQRFLTPEA